MADTMQLNQAGAAPMTVYDKIRCTRKSGRATSLDYIGQIFTEFTELHGDRRFGDDHAVVGGIAKLNGRPVTVIGIGGLFLLEEPDLRKREKQNYFANILYGFRPKAVRENPVLYKTLLAVAAFNISIQVFMPYLILYYTVSLEMDNYVLVMAPAIVLAAVFTAIYGRVYDRVGFRRAVIAPMTLLMAGYLVLYFCRGTLMVFIGSLLMMCGNLGGGAMLGAMVRDRTPENRTGMFQGLRICAQVLIPGIIGPAIGAWVLRSAATIVNGDGTSSFVPNANIFLAAFGAAIFLWLALIPLLRGKE